MVPVGDGTEKLSSRFSIRMSNSMRSIIGTSTGMSMRMRVRIRVPGV